MHGVHLVIMATGQVWQLCTDIRMLQNGVNLIGISDVQAQLGLKATVLAWLSTAWAFKICRLDQSH